MMKTYGFAFFSFSSAVILACGGSQPAAVPPKDLDTAPDAAAASNAADADAGALIASDAGPAPVVSPATVHFDDLPKDKKIEIMVTKVVPTLGKAFKAHDAKEFAKFGCASCHGPQKNQDPHAVLPKLTLSGDGFSKLAKKEPAMVKFMAEEVVPLMAAALGEPPFDPATKQGFGCAGCHTVN